MFMYTYKSEVSLEHKFTVTLSGKIRIPLPGLATPVGWLSFRNRFVVEDFGEVFVLSFCLYKCIFFCLYRDFLTGLSQVSSFFS